MRATLGENLVGLYLYGSLVTGDFDPATSDIDLLAVTRSALTEREIASLDKMHADFARQHGDWDGRIEVAYLSVDALKTYRTHASEIAVISPGEPFHTKEAGIDWLINWYVVREKGVVLFGPPQATFIDPITQEEYVRSVREYAAYLQERIDHVYTQPSQAYAILTACRALYTVKTGAIPSKRQAAEWAEKELPEWSTLIRNALAWREAWRDQSADHAATLDQTRRFVREVLESLG